jgi:hypothetical protein
MAAAAPGEGESFLPLRFKYSSGQACTSQKDAEPNWVEGLDGSGRVFEQLEEAFEHPYHQVGRNLDG